MHQVPFDPAYLFYGIIFGAIVLMLLSAAISTYRAASSQDDSLPFQYSPIALNKKKELEARDKALADKRELEAKWSLGLRLVNFMDAVAGIEKYADSLDRAMMENPYEKNTGKLEAAAKLIFDVGEVVYTMVCYEKRFAPEWLKRVNPAEYFRILEIFDEKGAQAFRAIVRFESEGETRKHIATILETFEMGMWQRVVREMLRDFEKGLGDYKIGEIK